ncbi:MAG: hypothetical protein H0Z31_15365 [Bacillus sp. (in: Bacteria)]|nr:hypothetical protein [Bacillus sp. (in: firmicutes)]
MSNRLSGAIQVAAVYIGTVVGAGFATGREIVEFFTRFGFIGFLSILLSGYLFIMMGTKLMEHAIEIQAQSYEEFNEYLFGRRLGKWMNVLVMLMLLGVGSVMLAGAGAVFTEQLGLHKEIGIGLTIGLAFIVMMVGVKGLFLVNTFVVPLMILFNFLLMIYSIQSANFTTSFLMIPFAEDGWKSVVAPFSYTAFNLCLAQAVLVPIATEVNDKKTIRLGGWLGGGFLTVILITSHMTLVTLPNVHLYEIPMAIVMKGAIQFLYWIYVFIIFAEIFTSVIGNSYGLEKQLRAHVPLHSMWIYGGLFTIMTIISQLDYSMLLSLLYPLFGYVSLLFLIILWIKPKVRT